MPYTPKATRLLVAPARRSLLNKRLDCGPTWRLEPHNEFAKRLEARKKYARMKLKRSAIFYADRRSNSSWCLHRRFFSRPQDVGKTYNSTRRTCHLQAPASVLLLTSLRLRICI
jgi:hypothetical protein